MSYECTLFVTFLSLIPVLFVSGHFYLKLRCGIHSLPVSIILSLIYSFLFTLLLFPQALRLKTLGIIFFLICIPTFSHLSVTPALALQWLLGLKSWRADKCAADGMPDCFRWDLSWHRIILNWIMRKLLHFISSLFFFSFLSSLLIFLMTSRRRFHFGVFLAKVRSLGGKRLAGLTIILFFIFFVCCSVLTFIVLFHWC